MICPNKKCKRSVPSIKCKTLKDGTPIWGCDTCLPILLDPHVYTGRKLWAGGEVYPVKNGRYVHEDNLKADTERAMKGGPELSF